MKNKKAVPGEGHHSEGQDTTNDTPQFSASGFAGQLDLPPTRSQRAVLRHLAAGRDLALDPSGRPLILQTGELISRRTVDALLLRRHWIRPAPGYPLLDPPTRLTERGRHALNR